VAGPALAAAVLGGPVAAVSGSPYALFAVVLVLAVAVFAALPPFWSVPPELLRGRALAVGVALINSFGSVGGFLAGLLTGWLGSFHHGFRPGLAVACAVMIVPAVAGFSWRRRGSHPPAAPTG
jgi:MFS transporter, ACS family, tartrate transporter